MKPCKHSPSGLCEQALKLHLKTKVFYSMEPLLEAIDISKPLQEGAVDWVIVGGESGHKARPMKTVWPDSIQKQCEAHGVPFFFKQWGEYVGGIGAKDSFVYLQNGVNTCGNKNTHDFGDGYIAQKVGKNKSGALLYDCEFKEFPTCLTQ